MIEYKEDWSTNGNSWKGPVLKAICAFANTGDGDLIIGIKETGDGKAEEVVGVETDNIDNKTNDLQNIIRDGLEPELSVFQVKSIPIEGNKHVFVVRVHKSWNAPHRSKADWKFYRRDSGQSNPMNIDEVRNAFTRHDQIIQSIRKYISDRIDIILKNGTPLPLESPVSIVLHIVPFESQLVQNKIDIQQAYNSSSRYFMPIGGGGSMMYDLDGILSYGMSSKNKCYKYTQVFRSGAIEILDNIGYKSEEKTIGSVAFEKDVLEIFPRVLDGLNLLGVGFPYIVSLSFININGFGLAVDRRSRRNPDLIWSESILRIPEVEINSAGDPDVLLKPVFDMLWNAYGYKGSLNYNENGRWVGK